MTIDDPEIYDPLRHGHMHDPWPAIAELRKTCPVHHSERYDVWVISRYEDVVAAARDTVRFSSATPVSGQKTMAPEALAELSGGAATWPMSDTLQTLDPPAHTANRKLFNAAFSPRRVAALEPFIRHVAAQLIDAFIDQDTVEFMSAYAIPLPMRAIGRVLGFGDDEIDQLKEWSEAIVTSLSSGLPVDVQRSSLRGLRGWGDRLVEAVTERRAHPRDDFLSVLANEARDDGTVFDDAELVSLATQTLVAGNETTTNLIGGMVYFLATEPALLSTVQASPELGSALVEEALRHITPVQGLYRRTTEPVELHGKTIPADARVQLLWAGANHDELQFPNPEAVELHRRNGRQHLAFGSGAHFCPGSPLSKLEARITLELLAPRLTELRLVDGWEPDWRPHFHLRGLETLPLEFTAVPFDTGAPVQQVGHQ